MKIIRLLLELLSEILLRNLRREVEITEIAPRVERTPTDYVVGNIRVVRVKYALEKFEKLSNVADNLPGLEKRKSPPLVFLPIMMGAFGKQPTKWLRAMIWCFRLSYNKGYGSNMRKHS